MIGLIRQTNRYYRIKWSFEYGAIFYGKMVSWVFTEPEVRNTRGQKGPEQKVIR